MKDSTTHLAFLLYTTVLSIKKNNSCLPFVFVFLVFRLRFARAACLSWLKRSMKISTSTLVQYIFSVQSGTWLQNNCYNVNISIFSPIFYKKLLVCWRHFKKADCRKISCKGLTIPSSRFLMRCSSLARVSMPNSASPSSPSASLRIRMAAFAANIRAV